MPCGGASDEQCGNGYKSSLYTYVPSVAKSMGCYIDSGSPRLLPSYSFSSSSMTPTLCQTACADKGYSFSGQCQAPPDVLILLIVSSCLRRFIWISVLLFLDCASFNRQDG
jgi:hypothetical protein